MKKILMTLSAVAIALGFAGCEKEQSSLDKSAFTEQAVVKGMVSYDSGYYVDAGGDEIDEFEKVAANQKLNYIITIDGGILGTGSTTTDANGMYSITVPTSYNMGTQVTITVNFEADYAVSATVTRKAVFSGYDYSLSPNETQIVNISATPDDLIPTPGDLN